MKRNIVLGLDGVGFRLIERFIQQDKHPLFANIMKEGSRGVLMSTIPPVTPPAWTSMVTGVNPGRHGIFDFQKISSDYRVHLVNARDKQAPELWDMVPEARCVVANLPATFPPREINGIMVSGMLTPGMEAGPARPKDFLEKMKATIPDFQFDVNWVAYVGRTERLLRKCLSMLDQKKRLLELLINQEWDLLFFVLTETDRAQHLLWEDESLYQVFCKIEELLEMLMQIEDSNIFIVSDHGFGEVMKRVYVNSILREAGLVKVRNGVRERLRKELDKARRMVKYSIRSGWGSRFIEKVPEAFLNRLTGKVVEGESATCQLSESMDMKETICFASGMGCVYLNKKGRFVDGKVEEREYDRVLDDIVNILSKYREPSSGNEVFRRVIPVEEIYHGPHVYEGPDIILEPAPGFSLSSGLSDVVIENLEKGRGDHRREGIFIASGPDVRTGYLGNIDVVDVTPTILHFMGCGIPRRLEGSLLEGVIQAGGDADREPLWLREDLAEKTLERIRRLRKLNAI